MLPAIKNAGKSRLDPIGRKRFSSSWRGTNGNRARPSSRAGPEDRKDEFCGRIHIFSKHKGDTPEGDKETDQWPKRQGLRPENEGATKLNRALQRALTAQPPESKITHDVAEFIVVHGLTKLTKDEEEATKDEDEVTKDVDVDEENMNYVDEDEQKWTRTLLNQRSFGFDNTINPRKMRLFKWDVTRAFSFSYFNLLRKVKKPEKR